MDWMKPCAYDAARQIAFHRAARPRQPGSILPSVLRASPLQPHPVHEARADSSEPVRLDES
jgi:hypothetical protein